MRSFITTALILAAALPGVASAQSREELRHDRREIRQERRELEHARAHGDWRDVRDQRGDLRDARREYREDLRDRDRRWRRDDWQDWRRHNRQVYARGNWHAPFRYQPFRPGVRIGAPFYAPRYVIADPWRYHLPPARRYTRWVRHYDDVLLIDQRRGVVVDVIRDFYR